MHTAGIPSSTLDFHKKYRGANRIDTLLNHPQCVFFSRQYKNFRIFLKKTFKKGGFFWKPKVGGILKPLIVRILVKELVKKIEQCGFPNSLLAKCRLPKRVCQFVWIATQPPEISYIARSHFYYIRVFFCANTMQKAAQKPYLRCLYDFEQYRLKFATLRGIASSLRAL